MNWAKLKTFLIVLFAVINVFLIATKVVTEQSSQKISHQIIVDTVNILNNNDIFIDEGIISDRVRNMEEISVKPVTRSDNYLKNISKADGLNFEMTLGEPVTTENEMKRLLKKNNFKNFKIIKNFSDGEGRATQYIDDMCIFGAEVSVTGNATSSKISGVWFEPMSEPDEINDKNIVILPSILINYISNEERPYEKHSIEKIEYGYYIMYNDPDAVLYTLVPCWKFSIDKGIDFYYDARTGEYIN